MALYVFMGIVAMWAIDAAKRAEYRTQLKTKISNYHFVTWIVIWVFIASFRRVDTGIGGSDAIGYVEYFRDCLNPGLNTIYSNHLDTGFQLLTKFIRLFTSNYHIYFIILYGIIAISYALFINELAPNKLYYEPMVLTFFLYLRGFNTLRTNISVAFYLLSLLCLYKKKYIKMLMFGVLCLGMHIATYLFIPIFGFYYLYKNKKLKIWQWILLYVMAIVCARFAQNILSGAVGLRGAYAYYSTVSNGSSFFDDGWKIAFGQILLMCLLIVFRKNIKKCTDGYTELDTRRYQFIYLLCVYDFLMIPVNYILNIWRGYEYLYIPRLIMWGVLMQTISNCLNSRSKKIFKYVILVAFIAWMIFRVYNTYADSDLMPYLFKL